MVAPGIEPGALINLKIQWRYYSLYIRRPTQKLLRHVGDDIKPFTEVVPNTVHVLCITKFVSDRIVAKNRNNGIGTFEQVQTLVISQYRYLTECSVKLSRTLADCGEKANSVMSSDWNFGAICKILCCKFIRHDFEYQ
jgi:hypothetical protein